MSSYIDSTGVNIYNIARTIGHCTVDLGKLCTSIKVNPFSRYKPMIVASVPDPYNRPAMDLAMEGAHYGYAGLYKTDKTDLKTGSLSWIYDRPGNNSYRIDDFNKYYHDAPPCLMQAAGTRFSVDMVRDNPYGFPFYILFRNAHPSITNKKFEKGVGISNTTAVSNSTYFASCMTIEDLYTDDGYGSTYKVIDQYNPSYLGWVIFPATGNDVYEYFSQVPLTEQSSASVVDNDMFILNMTDFSTTLNLGIGTYTAVACAKRTEEGLSYYMPVYGNVGFPARFTLDVGGLGMYPVEYLGVSETYNGTFTSSLSTLSWTVYIKVRIWNNADRQVIIHPATQVKREKVDLVVALGGGTSPNQDKVTIQGITTDIPAWSQTLTPYTSQTFQNSDITIEPRASAEIVYKVDKIWSTDNGTSAEQMIESPSKVTLRPRMFYKGMTGNLNAMYPLPSGQSAPSFVITCP